MDFLCFVWPEKSYPKQLVQRSPSGVQKWFKIAQMSINMLSWTRSRPGLEKGLENVQYCVLSQASKCGFGLRGVAKIIESHVHQKAA